MLNKIQSRQELKHNSGKELSALLKKHCSCIKLNYYRPDCSLDLDNALKHAFNELYAQANRWDYYVYVINASHFFSLFIEVHSCITKEVSCVLKKLEWLKQIINERYDFLTEGKIKIRYFWIPENGNHIQRHTPQYRKIMKSPIRLCNIINDKELDK